MKKVLVIEDQTILRDLICRLLESLPSLELVAATGDGKEGYELCLEYNLYIVILDMMLPHLHGLEVLRRLKEKHPRMRILVFSAMSNTGMVRKALELGVHGFIEKTAGVEEMEMAIEKIGAGGNYFGPRIVETMRELMLSGGQDDSVESLSPRECEIVKLVAEGFSSKEISNQLSVSPRTVDTHRNNIMRKLDLRNVADMTRYAIAQGLTEVPKQH